MSQPQPQVAQTPSDDFPPFGYLDDPAHCWKLHPSGVLRSRPPCGMGWHRPNYGSYGRNQFEDRAHLHVGIEAGGVRLVRTADFAAAGVGIGCDLHTALRLRYRWTHPAGIAVCALYHLIGVQALGCRIELRVVAPAGTSAAGPRVRLRTRTVRLWLALEVAHNPATSRLWEHGIYRVPPGDFTAASAGDARAAAAVGLLGICPEGDAWALGAAAEDQPLLPTAALWEDVGWLADGPIAPAPAGPEPEGLRHAVLALGYDLRLFGEQPTSVTAVLARAENADRALARWSAGWRAAPGALDLRAAQDEAYWQQAPQLSGDWPAHWRRGFVTDLETLRLSVRRPIGVFAGPWDGMQLQAPRLVLAEAALDALALSWADPALARAILRECFSSAARPNVPCMREDGSYSMVADDGAICGTGPEWGWPLLVCDRLFERSGDVAWLAALYPRLAAYLDWWLSERVDAEGWLVHACSWESGQDVSARFGEQQTGGSAVRHLRPVDLQAAVAQGAALLARWAAIVERPESERARWLAQSDRLGQQLQRMWRTDWFRDYDTRARRWSVVRDPMQLAPLLTGAATPEQRAALRPAFAALPAHGGAWPALVWPPVAITALEAAAAASLPERASELTAEIVERVWRRMDARSLEPDGGLPGVTREFWPEGGRETSAGIEGYGWGALTLHLLLRHVVGLHGLTPHGFLLTPALPRHLRRPGASYEVGPLPLATSTLSVRYHIPADANASANAEDVGVDITVTLSGAARPWVAHGPGVGPAPTAGAAPDAELARADPDATGSVRLRWRGAWHSTARVGEGTWATTGG